MPFHQPLKMEMRPGCQAGLANEAYLLVLLHVLPLLHTDTAQVPIAALTAIIVLHKHVVPQLVVPTGGGDHAVSNAPDRRSNRSGKVYTFVVFPLTQNGVHTKAVRGADPQTIAAQG